MQKGLQSSSGEKIGEMSVTTPEPASKDGNVLKKLDIQVDGESSTYTVPRFGSIDTIDTFGLPPFNEWAVGVKEIERREDELELGVDHYERFSVQKKTSLHADFQLERRKDGEYENYSAKEMLIPDRDISLGVFEVEHSNGECNFAVERTVARGDSEIRKLARENLNDYERKYLQGRKREERTPDLLVFKKISIDGETPAVQRELHPFWNKERWQDDEVRILELGYLDYGDNETKLDKRHGRWYKLLSFEDFDHSRLEIREGNWRSRMVDTGEGKKPAIENYEKYLYSLG